MLNKRKISIIGGAGHVGFPLGLIFSSKDFSVNLIDNNLTNTKKLTQVKVLFWKKELTRF